MNDRVVVVIPVHNESSVLGAVLTEVLAEFRHVVCVDDGSRDGSSEVARGLGAHVVRHATNLGQGAALETGLRYAVSTFDVEYVVTFDADGQHAAADATAMVAFAREHGLQAVLGSRFLGTVSGAPPLRRALLHAAVRFTRMTSGLTITDAHNGLRVLHRDLATHVRLRMHGMSHASEILGQIARGGWRYAEFPVSIRYTDYSRRKGQPGYNALNIAFDLALDRLRTAA
ncbi:glycosyltransferase involved in cell wall biosynthesis [Nocardioides ginsengisegetis]|uniref:Glycosyltransferase involved in cell wall biosynthesis n=1 Tax=Nocardioides ginsengisegetis TaxID=661491 RepID=A0A7W3J0G8_9ACTN|nr:glycosyltransferase involved in cell wall biosynthesis [Nocardioides ginsengisegetis]